MRMTQKSIMMGLKDGPPKMSLVVSGFEFGIEYSSGRGNLRHTAINCLKGFMAVSLFSTVPVRLYAKKAVRHSAITCLHH